LIRKARISDVKAIFALVDGFARKGDMLPRPISDIYSFMRDFFVYEEGGDVVGAAALHICMDGLGEVRSLAVDEKASKRGIGTALVNACLDEAAELGLDRVFALTYIPKFFGKFGFTEVEKEQLPHKVWGECVKCSKFPTCDEIAVIKRL
jgi:amino-acid N-acetyltransferase